MAKFYLIYPPTKIGSTILRVSIDIKHDHSEQMHEKLDFLRINFHIHASWAMAHSYTPRFGNISKRFIYVTKWHL